MPRYDDHHWSKPRMVEHVRELIDEDYDPDCDPIPQVVQAHWALNRHLPSAASYLLNCDYRRGCSNPDKFDRAITFLGSMRERTLSDFEDPALEFLCNG